jgi:hypothetical protein
MSNGAPRRLRMSRSGELCVRIETLAGQGLIG